MLHSLEIQNYRNLRHLTIEKLGRVNLLVGKNNTGKTSVLEALAIYASSEDELLTIKSLLQRRNEFYSSPAKLSRTSIQLGDSLASLSSLFTDYNPVFFSLKEQISGIYVGELIQQEISNIPSLILELRKAYKTSRTDEAGREINEYVVADSEADIEQREFRYEFKIIRNQFRQNTYSLNNGLLFMNSIRRSNNAPYQFQYVDSKNQTQQPIESLYSRIALSGKEDVILEALKMIDPQANQFRLIEDGRMIIRLNDGKTRNLSGMGDGISRVFSIIISMVNCDGTYLFIDEFENGLHFSVQKKLWEIIFRLAERLAIQVFATTHSNDTIKSFGEVASSKPDYHDAQLIQLRNIKGDITAVAFGTEEVEMAIDTDYLDLR